MTRKDYIILAQIIKNNTYKDGQVDGESRQVLDYGEFMHELCYMLEEDNPNFNEYVFRGATGEMLGQ